MHNYAHIYVGRTCSEKGPTSPKAKKGRLGSFKERIPRLGAQSIRAEEEEEIPCRVPRSPVPETSQDTALFPIACFSAAVTKTVLQKISVLRTRATQLSERYQKG